MNSDKLLRVFLFGAMCVSALIVFWVLFTPPTPADAIRAITPVDASERKYELRKAYENILICSIENDGLYGSYEEITSDACLAGTKIDTNNGKMPLVFGADTCNDPKAWQKNPVPDVVSRELTICTFSDTEINRSTSDQIIIYNRDKDTVFAIAYTSEQGLSQCRGEVRKKFECSI